MKKSLKQIAQIRSGYQFRGTIQASASGNVRVIQIKDFDPQGRLQLDGLTKVRVDDAERFLVREGDVLFQSRGRQLHATLIDNPLEAVVAVSHFFVLTALPDAILPGYLAWGLNHSEFQRRVSALVQTTSIPWISKTDFETLKLDVPPLDVQNRIVELVMLQSKQQELMSMLAFKREQLVDAVCKRLMVEGNSK